MGRLGRMLLLLLTLTSVVMAGKERQLLLSVPVQGKFPPPWTDSIRVAVTDEEELIQDHRHFKKGDKEFRAVLSGALRNKEYNLEILCMAKGGKPMAVFSGKIKLKADTKKLEVTNLKYLETIKD